MSDPPPPGSAIEAGFERMLFLIDAYAETLLEITPEERAHRPDARHGPGPPLILAPRET